MADFCKQCSEELFGKDFKDMAGLCTEEDDAVEMGATVLCEGCGPTIVNSKGECCFHEKAGGSSELCYTAYVDQQKAEGRTEEQIL